MHRYPPGGRSIRAILSGVLVAIASILASAAPAQALPKDALDGSAVAVTSMVANRLDVFTRGADSSLHHRFFSGGKWSGWEDLGGKLASAPAAASWANGRMDVFALGTDATLHHISYTSGVWSSWESLGGSLTSAPTVASWGSNRLDVFARGGDNTLRHLAWSGKWSSWESLGGVLTSAPAAASWGANHLDIFFRGAGNDLQHKSFLTTWSGISSLGGTITSAPTAVSWGTNRLDVFATGANGSLEQRWYNGAWQPWVNLGGTSSSAPAATSWAASRLDIFQVTDAELQQKTYSLTWSGWSRVAPLEPSMPTRPYTPTAVMQGPAGGAAIGGIDLAYVDRGGRMVQGRLAHPDGTTVVWDVAPGNEAFVGAPVLAAQADGRLSAFAQNLNGDVWARTQAATDNTEFGNWADVGGWTSTPPTVGRLEDKNVLFSVDADGRLWSKPQVAANGAFTTWRDLGDANIATSPTVVATRTALQLFALDTDGVLRTATYSAAGVLSAWAALSEPGLTGTPAAISYAGFRIRVFARGGDGVIVTKLQDASGAFPDAWDAVGTFVAAGSPSAVISPREGTAEIVARGQDGFIYRSGETLQGSNAWRAWELAARTTTDPIGAATDPTAYTLTNGSGSTWAIAFRDAIDVTYLLTGSYSATAGTDAESDGIDEAPVFVVQRLPAPPE